MPGRLVYGFNVSLDGYISDRDGGIDWGTPDAELHRFHNDLARDTVTEVYGRRLFELMAAFWPTADTDPDAPPEVVDFARIWRDTPRVVFSRTLTEVEHGRLARDDLGTELARLKSELDGDISIGGADLAAQAIRLGLVDEYRTFVHPVMLGGGTRYLPDLPDPIRLRLERTHTFAATGVTYLCHRVD